MSYKKLLHLTLIATILLTPLTTNLQPAQAAFPGLNGRVVFESDRSGNFEIYSMDSDGSNPVNLTNNAALDIGAEWSPDGTKILFRSQRDGADDTYIMNADGSNQQRLTTATGPDKQASFSPDGTKIAFDSQRDGGEPELYTMNADGTNQTRLTNNTTRDITPKFSPDGAKILFIGGSGATSEVYVMNTDGTNVQRLTTNAAVESNPDWSPDGSKIVFYSTRTGGGDVYTMNADGSNPLQITTEATVQVSPNWSPDGNKLVFQSNEGGDYELIISDVDGSNQVALTDNAFIDGNPRIQPLTLPPSTTTPNPTLDARSGEPVTYDTLANHTDSYEAIDPGSVTITTAPTKGAAIVDSTSGEITYTPDEQTVSLNPMTTTTATYTKPTTSPARAATASAHPASFLASLSTALSASLFPPVSAQSTSQDSLTYEVCSTANQALCTTNNLSFTLASATNPDSSEPLPSTLANTGFGSGLLGTLTALGAPVVGVWWGRKWLASRS